MSEEYISEELNGYQFPNGMSLTEETLVPRFRNILESKPAETHATDLGYAWNEGGLAQLFIETYKDCTRYCPERKSWYSYKEGKWIKDIGSLIVSDRVKEFIQLMELYSWTIKDEDLKVKYKKFLIKTGDRRFRDRLIKDSMDIMPINADKFDNNPYLINCKNGTYDLKKKIFRGHDWQDYLTMQTNFEYYLSIGQPKRCKRWETFIDEIMQGNEVKKNYLQRALGYSILGSSNEECMFICYGKTTRNGKSTLLDAIQHLLGDYSCVSPVSIICRSSTSKNADMASPTLANLKGKRFVTMAESSQYGKLDEETIKQLTGGEEITARALYENTISYKPQFTLWLSCNDLPSVQDKSVFASDRLRVIAFDKHFDESTRDKNLKELFRDSENMKGIFLWLLDGYYDYVKNGLNMPTEIKKVVEEYERDNDLVLQFLEDTCIKDENAQVNQKDLYDYYKSWCKKNGYLPFSAKRFNANVRSHTEWYDDEIVRKGIKVYVGLMTN